jgi:chromosome segregation ATPase
MRTLPLRDLPIDTNNPPMPIAVRRMLESAYPRGGTRERKAMISVPLVTLESIREQVRTMEMSGVTASKLLQIDEYKRQTSQAGEVEAELKSHISRLDRELKDHRKTLNKIESSNRAALQDRTVAEKERLRIEGLAAAAAKVAQKEKEKQQQRIDELESTIARLNENPESAKREEALTEVKGQLQLSESRRKSALSDVDFMKSRYQDVDSQALRLTNENKSLKIQNEELTQKASENLRAIHTQNLAIERQGLLQQIANLQAQVQQRDAELYNANQRLASVSNGRNTRGGSMPRSPRVPSGMSPRPRAAFSASRGTSPIGPGQQFVGQQAGNGRWNHLQ